MRLNAREPATSIVGSTTLAGDGKATNTAVNIKIIRLSEIYLIAAEAALHSTKQEAGADAAAGYLNRNPQAFSRTGTGHCRYHYR